MSKQNELTAKRQLEIDDMTQKYEDKIKLKEDMNKRIIKFRLFEVSTLFSLDEYIIFLLVVISL